MVEPQIVVLAVAGSSPVGHPIRFSFFSTKYWTQSFLVV
jgi:hypothetical protein